MSAIPKNYFNVSLVSPKNPEYRSWGRYHSLRKPGNGNPRNLGEFVSHKVEDVIRYLLGQHTSLQEERILSWLQPVHYRSDPDFSFRELDAVASDNTLICLYEIKLTTMRAMNRKSGSKQLRIAEEILASTQQYRSILQRLVYVIDDVNQVPDGCWGFGVEKNDFSTPFGIIWVLTEQVELAAGELGVELYPGWNNSEIRKESLETIDFSRRYHQAAYQTSFARAWKKAEDIKLLDN